LKPLDSESLPLDSLLDADPVEGVRLSEETGFITDKKFCCWVIGLFGLKLLCLVTGVLAEAEVGSGPWSELVEFAVVTGAEMEG